MKIFTASNFCIVYATAIALLSAVAAANAEQEESSTTVDVGRERIISYIADQQQFFVIDPSIDDEPTIKLSADPSTENGEAFTLSKFYWFCPPQQQQSTAGDNSTPNIVSHVIQYCNRTQTWYPMGYSAVWLGTGYDEILVNYAQSATMKIFPENDATTGLASVGSFQPPTSANQFVGSTFAGVGKWVSDISDPILSHLIDVVAAQDGQLGLTPDACTQLYQEVFTRSIDSLLEKDEERETRDDGSDDLDDTADLTVALEEGSGPSSSSALMTSTFAMVVVVAGWAVVLV